MEGNLIRVLFGKLLDALRIRQAPSFREPPAAKDHMKRESFAVLSDGIRIRGKLVFPSAHPSRLYPAVIICHGIPGSGARRPPDDPGYEQLAEHFATLGLAAVIFNFRGCGDSDGDFDMMGWTRDLEVVLDHIVDTPYIDPTRVMVLGFSGGGAAALQVAANDERIYALAVVGTPAHFGIFEKDSADIVADFRERGLFKDPGFPHDLERWLKGFEEIEPRRWVSQFKGKNLLVVHGDADELVPVEHAKEIMERAPRGIADLSIIPGGVHRLRLDPHAIDTASRWFLKTLGWER